MPIYTNVNIVTGNPDGSITFTPSGSAYAPTSSNASTAGQIDIVVSSHPISNLISNTELNPYLQIPLISGSHLSGTDSDLVIRFYSQSHIQTKYVNTVSKNNDITGYISSSIENFYVTASSTETFQFRDIPYITNDSGSVLRDKIFNVITGSAPHRQSLISASLHQSSLGGVKYFSCSIHYNNIRGNLKPPTRFTGSFSTLSSSLLINNIDLGSGAGLNFTEALIMPKVSSSLQMQFDPNDPTSIEFTQGTSSLSYVTSGRTEPTLMYFSSSGNVGVGTQDPKSTFDVSGSIKSDELVILGPTEGRPIKIKDTEIKFYETQETDPQSLDFGPNKEKARIRAVTGSFNLVFEVSSSNGYTNSVYISQSGKIGFNTDDPQSGLDAVVDEAQFQKPGSRAGLKINSEGNIESFDRSATTAATGSEVILKYSRGVELNSANVGIITGGTIEEAVDAAAKAAFLVLPQASQNKFLEKGEALGLVTPPAVGDVLGQVRWVAESGSIGDVDERVAGETAVIKAVVSAADDTGTSADLIFSVAGKTDGAQQKLLLDATNNHQLTGSLNVSGDVLATNVIASTIRMTNIVTNRIPFFNGTQLDDSIIYNRNGGIDVEGNITSSGNISASGELRISSIKGNNPLTIYSDFTNRGRIDLFNSSAGNAAQVKLYGGSAGLELQRNTGVVLTGDLTASGNISASGDGYFSNIYIPEGNKIIFDNETASDQFIRGSDSFITIEGDNNVNINADEAVTITTPSITASGNISASGDGYFANVGIGTTTPVDLLQIGAGGAPSFTTDPDIATTVASTTNGHEVAYQLHANEGTNNIRSKYFVDDTTLEAGFDTSYSTGLSGFVFQLVGSEKMRINVNGNVGIGTSTPPEKLTVTGNISASGNIEASTGELNGNLTFNGDNRHIYFGGTNTFIGERSNSTELELRGGGSNTAATVYIDNSGNLGLGVSNPLEKLHVDGNAVITGTLTAQEFHTEFVSASIIFSSGSTKFGDTSDDIHQFSGSLRVTGSGDHYILGGNVGVGTTSPTVPLEVISNNNTTARFYRTGNRTLIKIDADAGRTSAIAIAQGNTTQYYVGMPIQAVAGLGSRFAISYQGAPNFVINGNSGVGINVVAPQADFDVSGSILASGPNGNITASANISASGDITAANIFLPDSGKISFDNSLNGSDQFIVGGDNFIIIDGDNEIRLRGDSFIKIQDTSNDNTVVFDPIAGHITASGNISASGDGYFANVGIGTASPGHLLEVRGTGDALSVGDDTNTQTYMRFANERTQVGYSGANAVFQGGLSKGIRFNVNNNSFNSGNAMAILADGNVGIGTTAPTEKLQVTGNISASGKVVTTEIESSVQLLLDATNDITIDAGGGDIILSDDGVLTGTISLNNEHLDIRSRISNRDIRLKGNDGGTEITAMTIDMSAAGRVGIGTTAVSAKLHLSGSNGDAAESTLRQSRAGVKIWDQAIDSSGRLQWGYRSSEGGSRTVTFTLDDNNNVGIGTSAPSTKLHVDGDTLITGSAEDLLHVKTSTANKGFIKIESTHVPRLKLKSGTETMEIVGDAVGGFISGGGYIFNTPTSRDTFHFAINNTPKMTLEAGRLGIGQGYLHSNVPSEMLDVSGSAIVRGHITASGNISASGNLLVGGISAGDIKSSGDLKLRTTSADGDILLQSGSTTMFSVDGGLGRNKSFQHLQMSDGKALYAGDGLDLGIYHVSNNSYIENLTGDLTISNTGGGIVLGGSATQHITASGNISSSGTIIADKIGVGTSNPTSTAGSDNFIQIYGAVDSGLGIKSNNADWEFKNENPTGNLSLFSAGSSRVTFKEAGNVGIGTTAPPEKLTVVGNISASGQYIYGDTATPNLRLSHAAGSILSYGSSQLQNGGSLQFVTSTGTVFRVNQGGGGYISTGNIGFGTTSAPERITVEGNISSSGTITANAFVGDGSGLTNIPAGTTFTNISASGHISASEFVGGQGNPDVDTGTETVATATGATAAFFDYVAKNGTNLRAGTVTSVTDGTNVEFNEVSTVDLGDTSDIKFSVVLSSGDLLFKATVLSDNWNIKALVRKL